MTKNSAYGATLDRSDLYQIIARISVAPADTSGDFLRYKLKEILFGDPVYVAQQDSILAAAATMLDHGISWMPVVQSKNDLRPIGVLRGERISARMIQKIGHTEADQAKAAN